MKKMYISVCLLFAAQAFAQTSTNATDSKYQFTKVYHHDATPVESQGNSGTCWSFSTLSFLESELIRQGVKAPDALSEMYIARKAYEMKAERFIRMDGKINFAEGGAFHDIPIVMKKHGIVPKEIYTGLVNGKTEIDHEELFKMLDAYMKTVLEQVLKGQGIGIEWKKGFSSILDAYLGAEPTEFTFKGKKFTPKTYAESIGLKMDNYVSVTSFSNDPFYSTCEIAIPDNWNWGDSYNVPLEDLVTVTENALKAGYTLAWGADVSEKGFSFRNGIALVPEDEATIQQAGKDNKNFNTSGAERTSNAFMEPVKEKVITQELRQKGYDEKRTTDDHGMHIVGMYKDQNGTRFFLVKNSWGTSNLPQGYLYVSEHYFRLKTINVYVHKEAISKEMRDKLKL